MSSLAFPAPTNAPAHPAFSHRSRVYFDELDPMGVLHNSRYSIHVERATTALFESMGFRLEAEVSDNPDQLHVVRSFEIDLQMPFAGTGDLCVRLWVERLGRTSCAYGFVCAAIGGRVHAAGRRTIVKLDPDSFRPKPWTERFRHGHAGLVRDDEIHA